MIFKVIGFVFLLNSCAAMAEEKVATDLSGIFNLIPGNTIMWVMAVFAFMNGLSIGLEKLVKLTETKVDDKILAGLNKGLNLLKNVIEFLTVKGKR